MRQKSRKDLNQTAVVKELRDRGYDVDVVERPYDLVVSGVRLLSFGWNDFEDELILLDPFRVVCSVRVELKSEKGKLSKSQEKYTAGLKYPGSFLVATSSADDPMPAVMEIEKWFGR